MESKYAKIAQVFGGIRTKSSLSSHKNKVTEPLTDKIKSEDAWIRELAILHGEYKITEKGIAVLGEGRGIKFARKEVKKIATSESEIEKLQNRGLIEAKKLIRWCRKPELRIAVIEGLVQRCGNDPKKITYEKILQYNLASMIHVVGSVYAALVEAKFAYSREEIEKNVQQDKMPQEKIYPWELNKVPPKYWDDLEIRKIAIEWLAKKTDKEAAKLSKEDFNRWGLMGLLARYGGSPVKALYKTGFIKKPKPEKFSKERILRRTPYLKEKKYCKEAVEFIIKEKRIGVAQITTNHFEEFGFGQLLKKHGSSVLKVLVFADQAHSLEDAQKHATENKFREDKIYPWEIETHVHNNFWKNEVAQKAAFRWMLHKRATNGVPKDPRDVTIADFRKTGLSGLYAAAGNSVHSVEAACGIAYSRKEILNQIKNGKFDPEGRKIYPWELRKVANGFWDNQTNRGCATIWIAENSPEGPKQVSQITRKDFVHNGLLSLYQEYRGNREKMTKDARYAIDAAKRI